MPAEVAAYHGAAARIDAGTGPDVLLDAISLKAPDAWKRTKPLSSYYVAEFTLPRAGNDTADGRLLVSVGSGSIDTNIDVFKGEFDAVGEYAKRQQKEVAGFRVTFIDVAGGYIGGQHGQAAPAVAQPGYRMIIAVIPVGKQLHFVKAVGPQQTIAAHAEAINAFIASVQLRQGGLEMSEAASDNGNKVRLEPLTFTAPAAWTRTKPRSSLIHAEFALPHVDKDIADGRLTLSVVGGSVKDNVERWKSQFAGKIDNPKQEEIDVNGLKTTLVDFKGTYGEQSAMTGPVVDRPNYRMLAAVIPISDHLYVIKAVGPQQTISANVDAVNAFLASVKRD
jgi:hypothetical protein